MATIDKKKPRINKDLSNIKLTKRSITNQRHKLAQQLARINRLIESHISGAANCEQCNSEIKPFEISKTDLDVFKLIYSKTMSDIKDEDFLSATEPKSRSEIVGAMSQALTDRDLLIEVIDQYPDQAAQCLTILENKIKGIKAAV